MAISFPTKNMEECAYDTAEDGSYFFRVPGDGRHRHRLTGAVRPAVIIAS
jgi:hypothetical protein